MATRLVSTSPPRRQIIERRAARHLVVETARHVAHAARLAHAGAVEAERVIAAPRELEAAEENAHLLGVVHAVDHDHGRRRALHGRLHEQRGQGGAFIRHLDELDVRMAQPDALVPDLVGVRALRALFRAGRDETLGVVVIDAGAQVIVARGNLAAPGERGVALFLDLVAERAPLLEPGLAAVRFALARAQLFAGAVHLLERDHAVGRHALEDQGRVRPQEIVAEMVDPRAAGHVCFFPSKRGRRARRRPIRLIVRTGRRTKPGHVMLAKARPICQCRRP